MQLFTFPTSSLRLKIFRPTEFPRGVMEPCPLLSCLRLLLLIATVTGIPSYLGAQSFRPDTVRFLEQSTFGPTYDLIAHTEEVGLDAYLAEQAAAPIHDYPDLPFWPQTRPTTCTNAAPSTCQRDNYSLYLLQKQFFSNALSGQDQLRQRVAFPSLSAKSSSPRRCTFGCRAG